MFMRYLKDEVLKGIQSTTARWVRAKMYQESAAESLHVLECSTEFVSFTLSNSDCFNVLSHLDTQFATDVFNYICSNCRRECSSALALSSAFTLSKLFSLVLPFVRSFLQQKK